MAFQVILAGVGGQGILFTTRLIGEAALRRGDQAIGSETHGMSQRGGSVVSHVKIGGFSSPLVRLADADLVVALDENEAYRNLKFLRPRACGREVGSLVVNGKSSFPADPVRLALEAAGVGVGVIDANAIARCMGSPLIANLITLGFACAGERFPLDLEQLEDSVNQLSPARFREMNVEALREGHRRRSDSR